MKTKESVTVLASNSTICVVIFIVFLLLGTSLGIFVGSGFYLLHIITCLVGLILGILLLDDDMEGYETKKFYDICGLRPSSILDDGEGGYCLAVKFWGVYIREDTTYTSIEGAQEGLARVKPKKYTVIYEQESV